MNDYEFPLKSSPPLPEPDPRMTTNDLRLAPVLLLVEGSLRTADDGLGGSDFAGLPFLSRITTNERPLSCGCAGSLGAISPSCNPPSEDMDRLFPSLNRLIFCMNQFRRGWRASPSTSSSSSAMAFCGRLSMTLPLPRMWCAAPDGSPSTPASGPAPGPPITAAASANGLYSALVCSIIAVWLFVRTCTSGGVGLIAPGGSPDVT